jgi:TatD DNase family protein
MEGEQTVICREGDIQIEFGGGMESLHSLAEEDSPLSVMGFSVKIGEPPTMELAPVPVGGKGDLEVDEFVFDLEEDHGWEERAEEHSPITPLSVPVWEGGPKKKPRPSLKKRLARKRKERDAIGYRGQDTSVLRQQSGGFKLKSTRRSSSLEQKQCPFPGCGVYTSNIGVHQRNAHVPELFRCLEITSPQLARQRATLLRAISVATGVGSPEALVPMVGAALGTDIFLEPLTHAFAQICEEAGWVVPEGFSSQPINSPAVLAHWQVQIVVMSLLNPVQRDQFMTALREGPRGPEIEVSPGQAAGPSPSMLGGGKGRGILREWETDFLTPRRTSDPDPYIMVDSHWHYDRARRRVGGSAHLTASSFLSRPLTPAPSVPVRIVGGTVVYCDPKYWPKGEQLDSQLGHIPWKAAIGVHPKHAHQYNDFYHHRLGELLKGPRVGALGEVGLDFELATNRERGMQLSTFRWALQHAHEDVPLVLHLRGSREDTLGDLVGKQCREVMRQAGVSHLQKLHVHCFTGGFGEYCAWRKDYTRLCFGFTRLVTHFNPEQRQVVKELREGEILLESDTPYFPPPGGEYGHPQYLGEVAKEVAEIQGRSIGEVVEEASQNWGQLYQ